jgi:hypothetical protein
MLAPALREFTTLDEALERECADRLQQTEANVTLDVLGPPHEVFVDETPQQIQRLYTITPGLDAHRAAPVQCPATVEHGQATKESPLIIREQVVAPVNGGLQRLMAGRARSASRAQHPQGVRELWDHRLRR